MKRRRCLLALLLALFSGALRAQRPAATDDFRWMHGANYIPSYSATGVEMWLNFDPVVMDREFGFAQRIGLNAIRVYLQTLVYHHDPPRFLRNFEKLLEMADRRGLKVMPILFDSCFGVSPSLESKHLWVANPGPDRMTEEHWPESDAYARAVVSAHVGDRRIALWDVMNEPTATPLAETPEGRAQIQAFVAHYTRLVKQLDPTHALTVGVATADNTGVIGLVDVLSCHSYAPTRDAYRKDLQMTQNQARAAGKPWIVSESGAPGWGNHYEMVMPVLREFGVGHTIWEVVIGKAQFGPISGLFYPDGAVRRLSQIEAVMNARADFLREKPDSEGIPIISSVSRSLIAEYLGFTSRNAVTEETWRERNTLAFGLSRLPVFGDRKQQMQQVVDQARGEYRNGNKSRAFAMIGALLKDAPARYAAQKGESAAPKPEKAVIHRDVWGVPHIEADTEAAAMYALAQVQCEDYAKQVFDNLRAAVGRSAEVAGESAVERDRQIHLWRIPEIAAEIWRKSPPRTRRMVEAFVDGLNAYRAAHPEEVPNSLEATALQVIAGVKWFAVRSSFTILNADADNSLKGSVPPPSITGESNSFVIGPSRTASGKPILLIDPHWPADGPLSWLEFHLHAGRFNLGGYTVPGFPFAALAYNAGATWTGTAGGADSADAFELRVNPKDANQYWFDGAWKPMDVREAAVAVKKNGGVENRRFTFRESVHGPVFREQDGRVFAGAICGWRDTRTLEQWYAMNRAHTRDELLDALRMDQLTWINLSYATSEGHIGYIQTGCAPLRGERPGPWRAVDGTRSAAMWKGVLPFDKLPQVHDPQTGWIQNCNTAAHVVTSGLKMKASDFPPGALFGHYMDEGPVWRARGHRAAQVLATLQRATLDDARTLALDTLSPEAVIWAPAFVAAYDAQAKGAPDESFDLKTAADAVRNWNHRADKYSTAATVFRFWREEYWKLRPAAFGNNRDQAAPKSAAEQADVVKALKSATERMKKMYGSVLVPWGNVLRLRRDGIDLPLDGDAGAAFANETLRATGPNRMTADGRLVFSGGQVVPTVVELTNPIRVWAVVPFGQTRKTGARHSVDQMKLYSEGSMRPAWHDWRAKNHIESSRTLEYRPRE